MGVKNKHSFKPGQSGNPNGKPRLPDDIKQARKINKIVYERLLNEFLQMPMPDLVDKLKNPETPAMQLIVGKIITEAIKRGDQNRMNFLVERLVGKVPQKLEHTGADGGPINLRDLSDEELQRRINEFIQDQKKPE